MDISTIKKDAEEKMQMTLEFLEETFARIRAGRANVRIGIADIHDVALGVGIAHL